MKINQTDQVRAALNTLGATRWTLIQVKLFGKKQKDTSPKGQEMTITKYRGELYLTDYKRTDQS